MEYAIIFLVITASSFVAGFKLAEDSEERQEINQARETKRLTTAARQIGVK